MNDSKIEKYWSLLNNTIDFFKTGYKQNHGDCPIPEGVIKQNFTPSGEIKELARQELLEEFEEGISVCTLCSVSGERKFLVDSGSPYAKIFIVGDRPRGEDFEGNRVLAGSRGEFLRKWIESIGQSFEKNCFLTYLLKCHIEADASLSSERIASCIPYLHYQLEIVQPKVILCLGDEVGKALLSYRGDDSICYKDHQFQGIPVFVFNSPEQVMADPSLKRPVWENLKKIRTYLE
ncbi:MAG: uracil-DNA glycosylase [Spirochaetales bacterium]|nr:uracil-DNA glycosylase [Spirochaetales bacterium]